MLPHHEDVPALNGRKIKGFGTKYFCNLSSINRSGSNSKAVYVYQGSEACQFVPMDSGGAVTDRLDPRDPFVDASRKRDKKLYQHNYFPPNTM